MMLPAFIGRFVYRVTYPGIRFILKGSKRAYVVINCSGEVLVTKNWLGKQKKWRLPGGGINKGESAATAAARELHEELGITLTPNQLNRVSSKPIMASLKYEYDLFELTLSQKPEIKIDKHEILEARFVAITELQNSDLCEELNMYLELANIK